MPQCQFPVFCCFCVSEKLHRKYSWNWMKQKPKLLFFPDEGRGPKESQRGARGQAHQGVARPLLVVRPYGEVALAHFGRRLFAHIKPRDGKP
jgi:hypothetical protein